GLVAQRLAVPSGRSGARSTPGAGLRVPARPVPGRRVDCRDAADVLSSHLARSAISRNHPERGAQHGGRELVVAGYWQHWPTVFPQHGAGPKHARRIALTDWQTDITHAQPHELI